MAGGRLDRVDWWWAATVRGARGGITGGDADADRARWTGLGWNAGGRGGAAENDWEPGGFDRLLSGGLGGTCGCFGGNLGKSCFSSDRLISQVSCTADADSDRLGEAVQNLGSTSGNVSSMSSGSVCRSWTRFSMSTTTVRVYSSQTTSLQSALLFWQCWLGYKRAYAKLALQTMTIWISWASGMLPVENNVAFSTFWNRYLTSSRLRFTHLLLLV